MKWYALIHDSVIVAVQCFDHEPMIWNFAGVDQNGELSIAEVQVVIKHVLPPRL
jgi:hypothetical protein